MIKFQFQENNSGRFNLGLTGSTCTALPCWLRGTRAAQAERNVLSEVVHGAEHGSAAVAAVAQLSAPATSAHTSVLRVLIACPHMATTPGARVSFVQSNKI